MSELAALLKLLPILLGLVKSLQKAIDEAQTDRKVADDLKAIQEAIDRKDPDAIKHIFAGQ